MFDNRGIMDSTDQQFVPGAPIFDTAGEKVGSVSEHTVQGAYVVMHKGWLFPKDIYIPLSAVERADADGVYLRVYKDDISDQQTVTVPVRREEVPVERIPVTDDSAADVTDAFVERDIDIPVMSEEPVVQKRARVVEEVRVHKDVAADQEQVGDTVRRERVVVDGADDATGAGAGNTVTGSPVRDTRDAKDGVIEEDVVETDAPSAPMR
jgi:uncharacterized protein (TIGR02271 family)